MNDPFNVFAKARRIGEKMEREGYSYKGQINVYACTPPLMSNSSIKSGCGYWIVTIDRDTGVTPMFVRCGHCGGMATSRMYRVGSGLKPTHEWFRPQSKSQLPKGYLLAYVRDHLENGGLLLRPISKGEWRAPTPETRAFVEEEQRRIAELPASYLRAKRSNGDEGMSEIVERLGGAARGLCSKDAADYIPRGVSAADCIAAADYIEQPEREVAQLKRENAELLHDLERQMTIANTECNEAEELRAALNRESGRNG